jgi:16S rRNA (guanine966-N2)-methyltransferase
MRVIAGELRGRRLAAPDAAGVRPTGDRVREAMFDVLFSLGGVEGRRVLDLFAGSGALGIEALSRGAASATFVDRSAEVVAAVRRNLASVGLGGAESDGVATVVRATAESWIAGSAARFDIAFCDPPYDYEGWGALLAALPADLAVLESRRPVEVTDGWGVVRSRRYGGTLVTVIRAEPATTGAGARDPLPGAVPAVSGRAGHVHGGEP